MQHSFSILAASAAWFCSALAAAQQVQVAVDTQAQAAAPPTAASTPPAHPRAQNTWFGSSGGVRVIDGGSGEPGSVRLQLAFDYFGSSEFLRPKDKHRSLSGTLSLGGTPLEHLELFASIGSRSNSNEVSNPILLQTSGDLTLGAKGYLHVLPWLDAGVDLRVLVLNSIGELGVKGSATSLGLRAAASADLRKAAALPFPLLVRANVGYLLDNSSKLVESAEQARYNALPAASRREPRNEDRNLINRHERFGLGINRVDMLGFGLGLEAPFELAPELFLAPLVEWQLGVPINRQSYDCLSVPTEANVKSSDGCLAVTGLSAAPSTLTFGVRVQPRVPGLSALVAFDLGLLGATKFVRELMPNRPWALLIAIGYAIDTRKPAPEVRYVERSVAAAPQPKAADTRVRIRGTVLERGTGISVIGAVVRYPDRDLSPQLTGAEGTFTSYELPAGEVVMEITHPDYEPGRCVAQLTAAMPAHSARMAPRSGLAPAGTAAAPATPVAADGSSGGLVQARCELTARPRNGRIAGSVTDERGKPLTAITLDLSGPAARSVITGSGGELAASDLPPGEYSARVDHKDYLFKSQTLSVSAGKETTLNLSLVSRPKVSQVLLTSREVKIGTQVVFTPNSADIDPRSSGLLSEVADVLARNPQVKRVQVQGHTDNRGDPAHNRELSQRRAEAVAQWLVNAGVDPARLEAKGFGDEQPLAPNITAENRARNRRVQFVILKK